MEKKPFVTKSQVEEIVKTYPTPFHLYDEKGIRENAKKVKEAFAWNPGFREYFAVKATPNPYILKILQEYDMGCDCSSYTELMLAKSCHLKIWSQHSPNGMNGTAAFPILLLQFDKEQLCTGCFHTSYCLFAKCFLRKQSLHCNISLFRALPYSGLCFQISVYKFTDCHLSVHDIYK